MLELFRHFVLAVPDNDLQASFQDLPDDHYLKSEHIFRKRRFSKCLVDGKGVRWIPSTFSQSKAINGYLGDVVRQYQEVRSSEHATLSQMLLRIKRELFPSVDLEVGIHQMRTLATNDFYAHPAPEGIHQDGFDFIAIYCVSEDNVNGGANLILDNRNREIVLFEQKIKPGEVVILNDRELAHYVTPFTPKFPGMATRDMFVFTFTQVAKMAPRLQERFG